MRRDPPELVKKQLRQQVGFGCPAPRCSNPYLEYHHFDPPWHVEQHHRPEGIIPLCATHHAKAEAWTAEQLRKLKLHAAARADQIRGRFDWMRREVLAVVGGNYFYETPVMIEFRGVPMMWYERDDEGHLLLNLRMLSNSGEERTRLKDNDWIIRGNPADVLSPPKGHLLRVRYTNGDVVKVQFREIDTLDDLGTRYSLSRPSAFAALPFPLLATEITMTVGGTTVRFSPSRTTVGGWTFQGGLTMNCRVGFSFG